MHTTWEFIYYITCMGLFLVICHEDDSGSFFKSKNEHCYGDSCETKDSSALNYDNQPKEIDVMITFYNAVSNEKLQKQFEVTVSSLLKHATVPVALFIIGDEQSQSLASKIISQNYNNASYTIVKLDVAQLAEHLHEIITPMQEHFSYKPGSYYNHALFFLSLAMHKVMPTSIKKVIMLDADLKFMDDVKKLYDRFRVFKKDNIIGIGRDAQPVYRHTFWKYRQEHTGTRVGDPPPNGLTGFNSGVLLLNLEKMRESKLYNSLLSAEHIKQLTEEFHFKGHLGDQDFFTLIGMKYEWLFHVLPCTWNRQLCQWWKDHGYKDIFDQYFNCDGPVKIFHGNCGTPIPES